MFSFYNICMSITGVLCQGSFSSMDVGRTTLTTQFNYIYFVQAQKKTRICLTALEEKLHLNKKNWNKGCRVVDIYCKAL